MAMKINGMIRLLLSGNVQDCIVPVYLKKKKFKAGNTNVVEKIRMINHKDGLRG